MDPKYRRVKEVIGYAGAPHAKPGTAVCFGTDGIALTERRPWPYRGEPGDHLLKGHLTGPVEHPTSQEEHPKLRGLARAELAAEPTAGGAAAVSPADPSQPNEAARLTQELIGEGFAKRQVAKMLGRDASLVSQFFSKGKARQLRAFNPRGAEWQRMPAGAAGFHTERGCSGLGDRTDHLRVRPSGVSRNR
ncbi:hypothetical protein ACGF07_21445 [Kitasatospora sp. NPDC048194]|uniref:hypothetical protein n=1 Tax=Kitasatospora sp. NPDC048194 TaxID=3364045 RepID=UPI003719028E